MDVDHLTAEQRLYEENEELREQLRLLQKDYNRLLGKHQGRYWTIQNQKEKIDLLSRKLGELTGRGKEKYKNNGRKGKRR